MVISTLSNDKINVISQDGTRIEGLGAVVERGRILIDGVKHVIREGDQIERALPNGETELYEVIAREYMTGLGGGALAYTIITVQRGARKTHSKGELGVNYHIYGPNARVNSHSVDVSTNVATIDSHIEGGQNITGWSLTADGLSEDYLLLQDEYDRDLVEIISALVDAKNQLEDDYFEVKQVLTELLRLQVEDRSVAAVREEVAPIIDRRKGGISRFADLVKKAPEGVLHGLMSNTLFQVVILPLL